METFFVLFLLCDPLNFSKNLNIYFYQSGKPSIKMKNNEKIFIYNLTDVEDYIT